MFNIDLSNKIEISRGDSGSGILFLNRNDSYLIRYNLMKGDELYLSVFEPNSNFENGLIKKKYTLEDLNENGDVVLKFKSKDTMNLIPGLYYYQVKLRIKNAEDTDEEYEVNTVIEATQFRIY